MVKRIEWVDMARGLSMLAILLFHTEVYYGEKDIISYSLYVEDVLATFFILSGYLFLSREKSLNLKHKLHSVARFIVVPYLFFTSIIYIPKELIHGNAINIQNFLYSIFSGEASWFVSSLILSEVYFIFIHYIAKGKLSLITLLSFIPFVYYMICPKFKELAIPCVSTISVIFVFIGYLYRMYENSIERVGKYIFAITLFLLLTMKVYECFNHLKMVFFWMDVDNYILFFTDTLCFSYIIIYICKKVKRAPCIEWIGQRSLVYYFICGGVPLVVAKLMPAYNGAYYMIVIAFTATVFVATVLTWLIYKYLTCILGRKI